MSAPWIAVNQASGNVGVGTLTPACRLDVAGSANATNMGDMRNKVLNGDMRVDRTYAGTGHAVSSSVASSNIAGSLDKWQAAAGVASGAVCVDQIALTAADRNTVGGFDRAVQLSALPTAGLIAYLPFEGSNADTSGAGFLGAPTVTGTAVYSGQARVGDRSLDLTANTAGAPSGPTTVSFAYNYNNFSLPISTSVWVNPSVVNQQGMVVCFGNTSWGYTMTLNSSNIPYVDLYANSINNSVVSTTAIPVNIWTHLCSTVYPNGSLILYINGSVVASRNISGITNVVDTGGLTITKMQIGSMVGAVQYPYKGLVDDVRVYNRALSPSEITALANFGGVGVAPTSGLTARLAFDNAITDSVGLLTSPSTTGTIVYSPNCRSGSAALDLTANTAGSATLTTGVGYTISPAISNSGSGITISVWTNPSNVTVSEHSFLSIMPNSSTMANGVEFIVASGSFIINFNAVSVISTPFTMLAGTWYHIVVNITLTTFNIYVNGVLQRSFGLSNTYSWGFMTVGSRGSASRIAYQGLIDDVRIYNTALTPPSQVAGLYHSYATNGYSLYRQPIDGQNILDLAWGTSAAQPATLSCWLKNQSSVAQQYALSVNNNAGLVAYLPFNGSAMDQLGNFTGPVVTGTLAYSSSAKVGSQCLDLSANTMGSSTITTGLTYSGSIDLSFTISFWFNIGSANSGYPSLFEVASSFSGARITGATFMLTPSLALTIESIVAAGASQILSVNTWYHTTLTQSSNGTSTFYFNGQIISQYSFSGLTSAVNTIRIGGHGLSGSHAFKGLIDDVRIYNRALSASEIAAMYAANVSSTVASSVGMPRSLVYPTPAIPANSWQRVSVAIPGDTTGYWNTDNNTGAFVSLCLGAGSTYATSNVAAASNNSMAVWNSLPEYTSSNVQVLAGSSNNLMALTGSSVLMTGVQLERGDAATPFALRPGPMESMMSGLSSDAAGNASLVLGGNISAGNMGMFRNRIINGDMRIAQRGTSATISNSGTTYVLDRFGTGAGITTGSITVSQQTIGSNDTPYIYGFKNSQRITVTTACTNYTNIDPTHGVEGNNISDFNWGSAVGAPITISFWFKTNAATGSVLTVTLRNSTVTHTYVAPFTVITSGAWQFVTLNIPPPPVGSTWYIDNGLGMHVFMFAYYGNVAPTGNAWYAGNNRIVSNSTNIYATAGNFVEFTGLQLEKGTLATPFEFRPFAAELALCQRYCSVLTSTGSSYGFLGVGSMASTTAGEIYVQLPTKMRAATPTVTTSAASTFGIIGVGGSAQLTAIAPADGLTDISLRLSINITANVFAAGHSVILRTFASTTSYIAASAEL